MIQSPSLEQQHTGIGFIDCEGVLNVDDQTPENAGLPGAGAGNSEVAFVALQYVLGELNGSALEQFEARLCEDAAVADAVAAASRLVVGLTAIRTAPVIHPANPGPSRTSAVRRVAALLWTVTACLALVAGGTLLWPGGWNRSAEDLATTERLVGLWRDSNQWVRPANSISREPIETAELVETGDDDAASTDAAGESTTVPNWLIAAVSLETVTPEAPLHERIEQEDN